MNAVEGCQNVVEWNGETRLDVPSERILKHALDAGIEDVVVIGIAPDGGEWFESASADARTVLWLLERTKQLVLDTSTMPSGEPEDGA